MCNKMLLLDCLCPPTFQDVRLEGGLAVLAHLQEAAEALAAHKLIHQFLIILQQGGRASLVTTPGETLAAVGLGSVRTYVCMYVECRVWHSMCLMNACAHVRM